MAGRVCVRMLAAGKLPERYAEVRNKRDSRTHRTAKSCQQEYERQEIHLPK